MPFVITSIDVLSRAMPGGDNATKALERVTATGPLSYTTGGEAPNTASIARDLGLASVDWFDSEVASSGAINRQVVFDRTNGKLMAFTLAGVEVAAATDLSTTTFRFLVYGTVVNESL